MGHTREWKLVEITAEFIGWKVVVDGPSPCDAVCDVPAAFFNAEQNAHLIAATPALLAACEDPGTSDFMPDGYYQSWPEVLRDLVKTLRGMGPEGGLMSLWAQVIEAKADQFEAAIAKSEVTQESVDRLVEAVLRMNT
jgi:hypothetical protein